MEFKIPRLRVKCARILQRYPEFLKKPESFLKDIPADLDGLNNTLANECSKILINIKETTPEISVLDNFMKDLKIFLSENSTGVLSSNDEFQLNKPISVFHGAGIKTVEALENFGINSVKDIIFAFPLRYEELSTTPSGGKGILMGEYINSSVIRTKYGKQMFQAVFKGNTGYFGGIWLHFNKQFPLSILEKNKTYALYGNISSFNGKPSIFHPELIEEEEIGSVRRVYSIPSKINQKNYQKLVSQAIDDYIPYLGETLPENIRFAYRFPEIHDAVNTIHFPDTAVNASLIQNREHPAFQRFIFEELFYLQLRLLLRKSRYSQTSGIMYDISKEIMNDIAGIMPFKLTEGQRNAVKEIYSDMKSSKQMNRLLQGDVGSGKTIVSFIAGITAVKNGYQCAILAPTEILAEQHYENLEKFIKGTGYHACLLTGSLKAKDKKAVKGAIKNGYVHFIVGTHAVIQEDVEFKNLGLAVIDEQHRFGVKQRKSLMDKGFTPDMLLMTATPIPRTLALTYYGDLEISEIQGMPPGRIPPVTKAFREEKLQEAFKMAAEKLQDGEKAYFVYPAIEDTEKSNLKSVTKNVEIIRKYFKNKNVGLLHGKMKADEKSKLLNEFQKGNLDILVSTTVVEVGVDVKDATVILIENADRFGLAQLHQLRGRVGRNDKQSYCILVASEEVSETGFKRLRAMENFTSGFKLAELDLEIRGHGDFFGVKQSGMPEFQFADIVKDSSILKEARRKAEDIVNEDPMLNLQKNALIRSVLMQRWQDEYELFLVG